MVEELAPAEVHLVVTGPRAAGAVHRELAGEHQEPRHPADGRLQPRSRPTTAAASGTGARSTSAGCSSGGRPRSRPTGCTCCRCPGADAPRRDDLGPVRRARRRRPRLRRPDARASRTPRWAWPRPRRCAGSTPPRRLQLRDRPGHLHPHLPRRRAAGAPQGRAVLAGRGARSRRCRERGRDAVEYIARPGVRRDRRPRRRCWCPTSCRSGVRPSRSPTARSPRWRSSWPPGCCTTYATCATSAAQLRARARRTPSEQPRTRACAWRCRAGSRCCATCCCAGSTPSSRLRRAVGST